MSATEIKINVPELRFPEFKGEWEISKLEDMVSSIKSGKTKPDSVGKYNVYGSTGIIGKSNNFTHEGESILIARVGANAGLINIVNGKYGVTDNTLIIELNNQISNYFLFFTLTKFNLNRLVFGSGQPLITGGQLKKLKLNFPFLPEQQKIAAFLTAVDKRIHLLTQKKEKLEYYKKGVMQQLFSRELRFRDENGNDYPEWEEKRFDKIFEFIGTNSLSRSMLNYESGIIKNIHYGDIHTKFKLLFDVSKEDVPFINNEFDNSKFSNNQYCKEGDLVIADASEDYKDIGKSIEIINTNNCPLVSGLHTIHARPKRKSPLGFNAYLMQSSSVKKQLMRFASGISVLGISKNNLSLIILQLPCFKEQQKIASFLTAIDKQIEQIAQQIEHSNQWKKGLLQKMFV